MTCTACHGTGACPTCQGTGVIERTGPYHANRHDCDEIGCHACTKCYQATGLTVCDRDCPHTCRACGGHGGCVACNGLGIEERTIVRYADPAPGEPTGEATCVLVTTGDRS